MENINFQVFDTSKEDVKRIVISADGIGSGYQVKYDVLRDMFIQISEELDSELPK